MTLGVHAKPLNDLKWSDIEELHKVGAQESTTLEFKDSAVWSEGKHHPRDVALRAIVAFANAYGGVLVMGIAEDKTVKGVASTIMPIDKVYSRAESLQRAVTDSLDPPIGGLDWCIVEDPENASRGVIVIRVPSSQLAPHGFGKPSCAYIRRFAASEPMTMRDLQSTFWERRTKQERVREIRQAYSKRFEDILRARATNALADANGVTIPPKPRGAFTRCTAIFHDPLHIALSKLNSIEPPIPKSTGLEVGEVVEFRFGREPLVDGVKLIGRHANTWEIVKDGTINASGFSPDASGHENNQCPDLYAGLFRCVALLAYRLRRENERYTPFEIDIELIIELPAVAWISNVRRKNMNNEKVRVGPYLIASKLDLDLAMREAHVGLMRGFGVDIAEWTKPDTAFLENE